MATLDLEVSSILSSTGWTGATVANLSSDNDARATDGTVGELITAELDNSPGDFGSLNTVTLHVSARRQGTINRDKTILVELTNSVGTPLESFTTSVLGATDAQYDSSAFTRTDNASTIDGYRLRCTVQEGGGMPDTATVEIDHMWVTLDYNQAALEVTLVQGDLQVTSSAPTVTRTTNASATPGQADLQVNSSAPTVAVTDNKAVSFVASDLQVTSSAPTVSVTANASIALVQGDLQVTSSAPTVATTANHPISLIASELQINSFAPTVTATANINVSLVARDLQITSSAPTILVDTGKRYWVGGTDTWNATAGTKWATTSGGTGGASIPSSTLDAVFDANSGTGTVTIGASGAECKIFDSTNFGGTFTFSSNAVSVYGDIILGAGATFSVTTGRFTYLASTASTCTSNGISGPGLRIEAPAGSLTLADAFSAFSTGGSVVTVLEGTFDTGGFSVSVGQVTALGSSTRAITLNDSVVSLTRASSTTTIQSWTVNASGLTLNAGTSTISFANVGGTAGTAYQSFSGGGLTYYTIENARGTGDTVVINDSNTIDTLDIAKSSSGTITEFEVGSTQSIANLIQTTGTGHTIRSKSDAASPHTISDTTGTNSVTGTTVKQSTATGGATFTAYTHEGNTDAGGNSGWLFGPLQSTGQLEISSSAPTVVAGQTEITLVASNLQITSSAPTVSVSDNRSISLIASDLQINSYAPTIVVETFERYWVGGTDLWSATAGTKWAYISGGTGGAPVPTTSDDVFFDANSGSGTVTINPGYTALCKDFDCNGFTGTLAYGGVAQASLDIYGNVARLSSSMTVSGISYNVAFRPQAGIMEVTSNGKDWCGVASNGVTFAGATGSTIQLQDAFATAATGFGVLSGGFDANDFSVTGGRFNSSYATTRSVLMGNGVWTLTGTSTVWNTSDSSNLTFDAESSTIDFSNASTSARTMSLDASPQLTFNDINVSAGTGSFTFSANALLCRDLDFTGYAGSLVSGDKEFTGDVTISSGMSVSSGSSVWTFSGGGTQTLTTNGVSIPQHITITSGTNFVLAGALDTSIRHLTLTQGTFDSAGYSVTTDYIAWSGSNTRTLDIENSVVTLPASTASTVMNLATTTNATLIATNSTVDITATGASTYTFYVGGAGFTWNNIWNSTSGAGAVLLLRGDGATINSLDIAKTDASRTVHFKAGETFNLGEIKNTTSTGHTLTSDSAASHFLSDTADVNSLTDTTISWSSASGGAQFLAYTHDGNVDGGNNTGWVFALQLVLANLQINTYAPTVTVSSNNEINLLQANLEISPSVPTVSVTEYHFVNLFQADLAFNSYAPTVSATANVTVSLAQADLQITSFAPTVAATANHQIALVQADLQISSSAPTVSATANQTISLVAADLQITSSAVTATATDNHPIALVASDLAINTFAPTSTINAEILLAQANLQINTFAVSLIQTLDPPQQINSGKVFVSSDTTTSATLEDIDGASTTVTLLNDANIVAFMSLDCSTTSAGATGYWVIDINGVDSPEIARKMSTTLDFGVVGHVFRSGTLPAGTYTVKAEHRTDAGTLTSSAVALAAMALEDAGGNNINSVYATVASDTTTSGVNEDIDGLTQELTMAGASHIMGVIATSITHSQNNRESHVVLNFAGETFDIERTTGNANDVGALAVVGRTSQKSVNATETIKGQHRTESGTLTTAPSILFGMELAHDQTYEIPSSHNNSTAGSTTSATLVDIDGTSHQITLGITGHILSILSLDAQKSSAGDADFTISINGVDQETSTRTFSGSGDTGAIFVVSRTASPLSAGTYTVAGRWSTTGGTLSIPATGEANIISLALETSAVDTTEIDLVASDLQINTFAPSADVTQSVNFVQADLQINSFAPAVATTDNHFVALVAADLQITSSAPAVATAANQFVALVQADLQITSSAPTVATTANHAVTLVQGDLQISSFALTVAVSDNHFVALVQANLEIESFAPATGENKIITLSRADLQISTSAPTISRTDNHFVSTVQSNLEISSSAPTVSVSDVQSVAFVQADLQIATFAPSAAVTANQFIALIAANLEISAFAPIVATTANQQISLVGSNLEVSAFAPVVSAGAGHFVALVQSDLQITSSAPSITLTTSYDITLVQADLQINSFAPSVSVTTDVVPYGIDYWFAGWPLPYIAGDLNPGPQDYWIKGTPVPVLQITGPSILLVQGDLQISSSAPSVTVTTNRFIALAQSDLEISASAPSVTVSDSRVVELVQSDLQISSAAPGVATTDGHFVSLAQADLQVGSFAPTATVTANHFIQLAQADLQISAAAPTVQSSNSYAVSLIATDLQINSFAPTVTVTITTEIALAAGDLQITSSAPSVSVSDNHPIALVSGNLEISTSALTVTAGAAANISLVQADLQITTYAIAVAVGQYCRFPVFVPMYDFPVAVTGDIEETAVAVVAPMTDQLPLTNPDRQGVAVSADLGPDQVATTVGLC